MFDVIFGWRKATKCKNLIKRVKCRLKLLKNKRSCIIKQLKDDLGQLLRHGHYQIVFDRVDQLFMDDNMLVVYDLLENFCEFILINLPYIRRHKDCPNDINEAVSSLVFASTRLGNLPELPTIRKLFVQRYGKKFETSALELLPGNLVNHQIKQNLCIKSVSNEVKYKLVDEIARICFQQGPLLLEYRNESQQQHQVIGNRRDGEMRLKNSNIATEANIVSNDCSCATDETSTDYLSAIEQTSIGSVHCSRNNEHERVSKPVRCSDYSSQCTISSPELVMKREFRRTNGFISGQTTDQLAYKDDVEEFESILSKDLNFQDQRLFMFRGPLFPLMLKMDTDHTDHINVSISPLQKTRLIAMKDASFMTDDLEGCSFTFSSSAPAMTRGQLYMRTRTMPVDRPNDNLEDNFLRSNSFPVIHEPSEGSSLKSYVHPKLPDYDEIAAMFKALKKEKLQKKKC